MFSLGLQRLFHMHSAPPHVLTVGYPSGTVCIKVITSTALQPAPPRPPNIFKGTTMTNDAREQSAMALHIMDSGDATPRRER
jgi:hypothetical protein